MDTNTLTHTDTDTETCTRKPLTYRHIEVHSGAGRDIELQPSDRRTDLKMDRQRGRQRYD